MFLRVLMFLTLIYCAANAGELKSAKALHATWSSHGLDLSLDAGFHFNKEAPNRVKLSSESVKPQVIQDRAMKFTWVDSKSADREAQIYVCDDAKTFCEAHVLQSRLNGSITSDLPRTPKKNSTEEKNSLSQMLARAQKSQQPVFLDFSARWCPGCVRYEKEIFTAREFAKYHNTFYKVDVDLFENFDLSKDYKVQGIPTIIAIDADRKEISRLVDFQSLPVLTRYLEQTKKDYKKNLAPTKDSSTAPADSAVRLSQARAALDRGDWASAEKLLEGSPRSLLVEEVQVEKYKEIVKKDPAKKVELVAALENAIAASAGTTKSLAFRNDLLETLDASALAQKQKVQKEGLDLVEKLLKDPAALKAALQRDSVGEFLGHEKMYLAELRVGLLEGGGSSEAVVQKGWDDAIDIARGEKISAGQAGPALRKLIFLNSGKHYVEAIGWADQILKISPENTDVKRRKIKALMGLEKFGEALKLGQEILNQSEGVNYFRVAESIAKAQLATNQNQEAEKFVLMVQSRPELELEKMKPTKDSFADLLQKAQNLSAKR